MLSTELNSLKELIEEKHANLRDQISFVAKNVTSNSVKLDKLGSKIFGNGEGLESRLVRMETQASWIRYAGAVLTTTVLAALGFLLKWALFPG